MPKPTSYSDRARLRLSRTPEFYRRFIKDLQRSGMTAAAYCRNHQVATGTVRKYLRAQDDPSHAHSSRRKAIRSEALPTLVPVRSVPERHPEAPWALEAALPDGTRLRFAQVEDRILSLLLGGRT
jgi:hypothetical protein